jgi:AraC family transcriptional regulator
VTISETWQKLLFPISTSDSLRTALKRKHRDGVAGGNFGTLLAEGDGWRVLDIICSAGPHDRAFEERHDWSSISLVMAGAFAYRTHRGSMLMSSGALMLGNFGQSFECSHHGEGDRCLSFQFTPEMFEGITPDAGAPRAAFEHDRIPPLRALAALTAWAANAIGKPTALEEIGLELAGAVLQMQRTRGRATTARDRIRIAEVIRHLETHREARHMLPELARLARLSRYHFLRTFRDVTGITPHQWILRARLREAAKRLAAGKGPITEIALEVGFEDLSNFIRSFRAEFGISPRAYRASAA